MIWIIFLRTKYLPDGELNPGLPRDRRGYSPLYYRGSDVMLLLSGSNNFSSWRENILIVTLAVTKEPLLVAEKNIKCSKVHLPRKHNKSQCRFHSLYHKNYFYAYIDQFYWQLLDYYYRAASYHLKSLNLLWRCHLFQL